MGKRLFAISVVVCATGGMGVLSVQADTISYGPLSIPLSSTNWSGSINVPLFDPALGTLLGIEFHLEGHVEGTAKFESLDASPATITMNLAAQIVLQRPDTSVLAVVLPLAQTVDNVPAFDGVIDFGGTSGKTYAGLSADDVDDAVSPPPASDLVLFTGVGSIVLPVVATGQSNASGAGNLITQFNTSASASASVTYIYEIPEPASLSLLALGGLLVLRRRR